MLLGRLVSFIKTTVADVVRILTSREGLKNLYGVSLYRNAVYLMLSSGVGALTGFFFWIVAARMYSTEAVGLSSAAISAMGLLAILATLGLDYGIIRFLPSSGEKAGKMINSCFTIGALVSVVVSVIFISGLDIWSPALLPIRDNAFYFIAFVLFAMFATLQHFNQQSFVAMRRTGFSLAQSLITNLLRFVPLIILASLLETFGIFASSGIAISITVICSVFLFLPRVNKGYRPLPLIQKDIVRGMLQFSFANYIANILLVLPQLVLPLIVVNVLGAENNAYFYIAWGVASIVFMIPQAASFSLLAEASHDEKRINIELLKSLKLILVLLVPAIIVLLLLGDKILLVFSSEYSANSTKLLWVLSCSALPLGLNHLYFTIKRVEKKMKSVILLNIFIVAVTLGLSYLLLPSMGIIGAGLGWLISHGIVAVFTLSYLIRRLLKKI